MTATQRRQTAALKLAGRIADLIEQAGRPRQNMFNLIPVVLNWARRAASLRKRYEADCSYQWADTDEYRAATERAEKRLMKAVEDFGLFAYLQGDCRGATLYVDSKPIHESRYTNSVCVFL